MTFLKRKIFVVSELFVLSHQVRSTELLKADITAILLTLRVVASHVSHQVAFNPKLSTANRTDMSSILVSLNVAP